MPTDFDRADNMHRPPLGKTHRPTGTPLIVTPTCVSRVDCTAWTERPQDSGSANTQHGNEIYLPNWRAGALALEGDPNLGFEHWDEYWRKIHGPKFAQPATAEFVRRYAQLHTIGSTQKDPEGSKIDAVSVLAFALSDVEDYLLSDDHAAIEASENALAGDGSEWWTAINYSIINRLLPEVVTTL